MSTVLLFGDQTAEQYPLIHQIVLRKENALVRSFVERVSVALREETRSLSRSQRDLIPDFLTVNDRGNSACHKSAKLFLALNRHASELAILTGFESGTDDTCSDQVVVCDFVLCYDTHH